MSGSREKKCSQNLLSDIYCISLEELVRSYPPYADPILYAFIGSWMLASLVRYSPFEWQEILRGENDQIVIAIREYRRNKIAPAIRDFLSDYAQLASSW